MLYDKIIKWCEKRKEKRDIRINKHISKLNKKAQLEKATKKELLEMKESFEQSIIKIQSKLQNKFDKDLLQLQIQIDELNSEFKPQIVEMCKVPGCNNKAFRAGKCRKHYLPEGKKKCAVRGCENYAIDYKKYCGAHLDRYRRWGNPYIKYSPGGERLCCIVHCKNPHYEAGYCKEHIQYENGKPINSAEVGEMMRKLRKAEMVH